MPNITKIRQWFNDWVGVNVVVLCMLLCFITLSLVINLENKIKVNHINEEKNRTAYIANIAIRTWNIDAKTDSIYVKQLQLERMLINYAREVHPFIPKAGITNRRNK